MREGADEAVLEQPPAHIVTGFETARRIHKPEEAATVALVLIVELLNSAVEAAVDRVSFERHELSGRAKDYGSAAVLLALLLCGTTWGAALWQRWTLG